MKLLKITALAIPFLLFTIIFGQSQILDTAVATINYTTPEIITEKQLNNAIVKIKQQYSAANQPVPPKENILEELMISKLINQAAQDEGLMVTDSEVIATVKQQVMAQGMNISDAQLKTLIYQQTGMSWEEYVSQSKNQLLAQKYVKYKKQSLFDSIKPPSESEIEDIYQANSHLFINPEMVRFSQIYRDTRNLSSSEKRKERELMEEIYRDLRNGSAGFEDMAIKFSDDKELRHQGGDVGFLARNDVNSQMLLGNRFFKIAFSTETGSITQVIESNIGFHILKITDHLPKRFLELDDPVSPASNETVRQRIINLKKMEKQQEIFKQAVDDIVEDLKDQADIRIIKDSIDINEENLSYFREFVQ